MTPAKRDTATPAPDTPPTSHATTAKVIVRLRPLTPADGPHVVTPTPDATSLSLAAVPPAVPAADFDFPDGVMDGDADQDAVWSAVADGVACVARGTCALVSAYGDRGGEGAASDGLVGVFPCISDLYPPFTTQDKPGPAKRTPFLAPPPPRASHRARRPRWPPRPRPAPPCT